MDFIDALKIATGVFDQYKIDQFKWWKRMDGTPILNDVAVRMAREFDRAWSDEEVADHDRLLAENEALKAENEQLKLRVTKLGAKSDCDFKEYKRLRDKFQYGFFGGLPEAEIDEGVDVDIQEQAK